MYHAAQGIRAILNRTASAQRLHMRNGEDTYCIQVLIGAIPESGIVEPDTVNKQQNLITGESAHKGRSSAVICLLNKQSGHGSQRLGGRSELTVH